MEIIYINKDIIAVKKPAGIPSQSDPGGDKDAMTLASEALKTAGEPSRLWLVHRLDRVVGGLLVFARNKESAAELSSAVSEREMKKEYIAVVSGEPSGGEMRDYIYKDAKAGKAFTVSGERKGVKEAVLEYEKISTAETEKGKYSLVKINLITGRFHQIRVQFASRGFSIVGDGKYGSRDNGAGFPALYASGLSFNYKKGSFSFCDYPSSVDYPWCIFADDIERLKNDRKALL